MLTLDLFGKMSRNSLMETVASVNLLSPEEEDHQDDPGKQQSQGGQRQREGRPVGKRDTRPTLRLSQLVVALVEIAAKHLFETTESDVKSIIYFF
jgi:hypothetical protein